MKKIAYLLTILIAMMAIAFWLTSNEPERKKYTISLVQLTGVDNKTVAGFKAGMEAAGYQDGIDIDYLSEGPAGKIERLKGIIQRNLSKQPDLIMVSSTPATQEVKRQTAGLKIPVVFAPVNDPLNSNIVTNLRHPGGYITGIRLPTGDDLRLKWLVDVVPSTRHVFVPFTPGDKSAQATLENIKGVAPELGIKLLIQAIKGKKELQVALASLPADVDSIFLPRDSSIESQIDTIVSYANEYRLAISAPSLTQVEAGALLSYGFVHYAIGQQAAHLAVQILKGTHAGDLPVEMAENLLSLNSVTAQQIGLNISDEVLHRIDMIIRQ
jgi:putative tryptophan/tyrosine transport system substrate-binding protein